jgi:hypothetical protein
MNDQYSGFRELLVFGEQQAIQVGYAIDRFAEFDAIWRSRGQSVQERSGISDVFSLPF